MDVQTQSWPGFLSQLCPPARTEILAKLWPWKTGSVNLLVFQYNYRNRGSLTFEPLTLVPIQVKMINTALLTQKEVRTAGQMISQQLVSKLPKASTLV